MIGARLRTTRFFVLQCYPTVSAVHGQCPFRFSVPQSAVHHQCPLRSSVPQSAVHRPLSVSAPFLRSSVLSTPSECCPPSVPIPFPRVSECCPPSVSASLFGSSVHSHPQSAVPILRTSECCSPSVPNPFLRASVLSTVYRQCPLRSVLSTLRVLSTVSARFVPPFLCASECCPPSAPNPFLRASVLSIVS
jgi:hypothetical protein